MVEGVPMPNSVDHVRESRDGQRSSETNDERWRWQRKLNQAGRDCRTFKKLDLVDDWKKA